MNDVKRKRKSVKREGNGCMKRKEKFASLLAFKLATHIQYTHTRARAQPLIVKKLCYYYNNQLLLCDGFLICFTRGFQSQF